MLCRCEPNDRYRRGCQVSAEGLSPHRESVLATVRTNERPMTHHPEWTLVSYVSGRPLVPRVGEKHDSPVTPRTPFRFRRASGVICLHGCACFLTSSPALLWQPSLRRGLFHQRTAMVTIACRERIGLSLTVHGDVRDATGLEGHGRRARRASNIYLQGVHRRGVGTAAGYS